MTMQLRKATRKKAKLRVGLSGPSGSGKTYSALLLARGLASEWAKVAIIDTENGSGELYDNLGEYNAITLLPPYSPERYIEAIKACEDAGMEVIVIDSVTHEWDGEGGSLQINEKLANAKFRGNTWAAWSETTPRHQAFINKILASSCHIVTTARSKTETVQTEDKKVKKIGMKEIQRDGYEYELTVNFNLDRDKHLAIASKDRTELFIDADPFLINEKVGQDLLEWANKGIEAPIQEEKVPETTSVSEDATGKKPWTPPIHNTKIEKLDENCSFSIQVKWSPVEQKKILESKLFAIHSFSKRTGGYGYKLGNYEGEWDYLKDSFVDTLANAFGVN